MVDGPAPDGPPAPDPGVLHKVRSLLAKAESTSFPEEAEALTAKAQQLMDRHAIDRAVLARASGGSAGPEGRTLLVEAPYARPKFGLLSEVARANRCRAVWNTHSRVATVIGFPEDQLTVELLYTSLLVQGTRAMLASGTAAATRSRGYRHAFLTAFAFRIGERLRAAAEATVRAASHDHGAGLLPVLRDREAAVEQRVQEAFPRLRSLGVSVSDPAGLVAGRSAADRARLGGAEVQGRARGLRR